MLSLPAADRRHWYTNLWLWWILTMVCITAIYAYFW
jgi:Mg2+ and Co2+ transporter CorA